jgi:hypothetical protein
VTPDAGQEPSAELAPLLDAVLTRRAWHARAFERVLARPGFVPVWHWSAALLGVYWTIYRRRRVDGVAHLLAGGLAGALLTPPGAIVLGVTMLQVAPSGPWLPAWMIAYGFAAACVYPWFATARYARDLRRRHDAGRAAGEADPLARLRHRPLRNAAGAGMLALIVAVVVDAQRDFGHHERVVEALDSIRPLREAVAAQVATSGRLPRADEVAHLPAASRSRYVSAVRIADGGRIEVSLGAAGAPEGRIVLDPVMEAGRVARWECRSDVTLHRYIAADCRR